MSYRSHGTKYSVGRGHTFSEAAWERMKAAQARFTVEAFAKGQADRCAGRGPLPNQCPAYYEGYRQPYEVTW